MQRTLRRACACAALATAAALVFVPGALAHAGVSPPVGLKGHGQLFTLTVPTEEENLTTTQVELIVPVGFAVFSVGPSPGWKRTQVAEGSGEEQTIKSVKWTGGSVPTGELAVFQFVGSPDSAKDYRFEVRQTYSGGKVVNWSGPESSDTPAPLVEAKSSFGGGGSTLGLIAIIVAALALLVGLGGLVTGGRRPIA